MHLSHDMHRSLIQLVVWGCLLSFAAAAQIFPSPNATASASRYYSGSSAAQLTAGGFWNSGARPTQWILIDLGAVSSVSSISLFVSMTPTGATTHEIKYGTTPDVYTSFLTNSGTFATGSEWWNTTMPVTARYIQVVTSRSPSWVAWSATRVYGAVVCDQGAFYNATLQTCQSCPVGTYQTLTSAESCVACPAGTSTASTGSTSAAMCLCAAGSTRVNSTCAACPIGTYKSTVGDGQCTSCPTGLTSPAGSTSVTNCNGCSSGYVLFNSVCTLVCDHGYKNNYNTGCRVCDSGYSGAMCDVLVSGSVCTVNVPTKNSTGEGYAPIVQNSNYENNMLSVTISSPVVHNRRFTKITMREASSNICDVFSNATTLWTESFTNCTNQYAFKMPWANHTACGFNQVIDEEGFKTFKGVALFEYRDVLGNLASRNQSVPITRDAAKFFDIYVKFRMTLSVSISDIQVDSPVPIDVALTRESYDYVNKVLNVELTSITKYSSMLSEVDNQISMKTPAHILLVNGTTLSNVACTQTLNSLCVQKISFGLKLDQESICDFGGQYELDTAVYSCRENEGKGCSTSPVHIAFELASESVCAKVQIDQKYSASLSVEKIIDQPKLAPHVGFRVGDHLGFTLLTSTPNDNTVTFRFVNITYDDNTGAGPQPLMQNKVVTDAGLATNIDYNNAAKTFALYLAGTVFKQPMVTGYTRTYTFGVVVEVVVPGNKKRDAVNFDDDVTVMNMIRKVEIGFPQENANAVDYTPTTTIVKQVLLVGGLFAGVGVLVLALLVLKLQRRL